MPTSTSEPAERVAALKRAASAEGFDLCRITSAHLPLAVRNDLQAFVAQGRHGGMAWLADTAPRRATPQAMWPEARSAIVLALSYHQGLDHQQRLARRERGVISVYALNRDYHDVIKGKLKRLAQGFARASGAQVKVFVDTAPLMEKPLAQQAGLGWQGKHTNLLSRDLGSWFFLGVILTSADLPPDAAENDHCGACRACLEACPTQAFTAPHEIDARRCLSYLTIEHPGHIAREFRTAMGNRIYGCDDCLAVCPWNKFARAAREAKLAARADLLAPDLAALLALDDAAFRALFSGSPVKRVGHARFLRNTLIAAGNSGAAALVPRIAPHLAHASPLVRAMAVWALMQLVAPVAFASLRAAHRPAETDPDVRAEWDAPDTVRD
ncbi:MAG TPA: tRNA epoxyqueuosine(34) reductase QueG [Aestuariivirga sp.]|nr:tRNA epoxyqueuosine(34) reductase QueG [Aestuariivirga sp.]